MHLIIGAHKLELPEVTAHKAGGVTLEIGPILKRTDETIGRIYIGCNHQIVRRCIEECPPLLNADITL